MKFQTQRIQVPVGHNRNEDGSVTAEWEDRLVSTPQELQEAINAINAFQKETQNAKIDNATKLIDKRGARVPNTKRLHVNQIKTRRQIESIKNGGSNLAPYK